MFCSKCGKKIKEEAKFCPYCGAKTEVPEWVSSVKPEIHKTIGNYNDAQQHYVINNTPDQNSGFSAPSFDRTSMSSESKPVYTVRSKVRPVRYVAAAILGVLGIIVWACTGIQVSSFAGTGVYFDEDLGSFIYPLEKEYLLPEVVRIMLTIMGIVFILVAIALVIFLFTREGKFYINFYGDHAEGVNAFQPFNISGTDIMEVRNSQLEGQKTVTVYTVSREYVFKDYSRDAEVIYRKFSDLKESSRGEL